MDRYLVSFFILAYFIGWAPIVLLSSIAQDSGIDSWLTLSGMAESWRWEGTNLTVPPWTVYLVTRVQDFAFSLSGIVLVFYLQGSAGLRDLFRRLFVWRVGRIWWLAIMPFVFYGIAAALAGAFGSFTLDVSSLQPLLFSLETGLVITLLLRGPMGEELGLRGFALVRLQQRMTAIRSSIIIGAFWALWHLPVLMDRDLVSIIAFLLLAFGISFVFTWIFNSSGGSLLPVLVFHGMQNSEETFEILFPALLGSNWELVSFICMLLFSVLAFLKLRTRVG